MGFSGDESQRFPPRCILGRLCCRWPPASSSDRYKADGRLQPLVPQLLPPCPEPSRPPAPLSDPPAPAPGQCANFFLGKDLGTIRRGRSGALCVKLSLGVSSRSPYKLAPPPRPRHIAAREVIRFPPALSLCSQQTNVVIGQEQTRLAPPDPSPRL
eukprot:73308-Hanusia_phi.AAC.1